MPRVHVVLFLLINCKYTKINKNQRIRNLFHLQRSSHFQKESPSYWSSLPSNKERGKECFPFGENEALIKDLLVPCHRDAFQLLRIGDVSLRRCDVLYNSEGLLWMSLSLTKERCISIPVRYSHSLLSSLQASGRCLQLSGMNWEVFSVSGRSKSCGAAQTGVCILALPLSWCVVADKVS